MLADGVAQGGGRPLAGTDATLHPGEQAFAAEHHGKGVEQGAFLVRQALGHPGAQRRQLFAHRRARGPQALHLQLGIVTDTIRNRVQFRLGIDHHRLPGGHAGRAGHAAQGVAAHQPVPIGGRVGHHLAQLGMDDAAGKLGGQGDKEGFLVAGEAAFVAILHHQHPEHLAAQQDRGAEEGVVRLLADVGDVLVTGVARGVVEVERLGALGHQADQPLVHGQGDPTDRGPGQALGRHQHKLRILPSHLVTGHQIDRADGHLETVAHAAHNGLQRRVQIRRAAHFTDDVAQGIEDHPPSARTRPSASQPQASGCPPSPGKIRGASSCKARVYTSRLNVTTSSSGSQ